METPDESAVLFIESRVEMDANGGCWLWTGAATAKGYARTTFYGKNTSIHRLSYRTFKGDIPEGLFVCHRCDVRSCVNPDHLWLGTVKDNNRDALKKGRNRPGTDRKLTEDDVRFIRRSDLSIRSLAQRFSVSKPTIVNAQKGDFYAWVKDGGRET